MYNPEEIEIFCPKSCCFRSSSNSFMNVMQQLRPDSIQYGTVQLGPRAQIMKLFLVFTYIWQKDVAKISKMPRTPCNVDAARQLHAIVSVTIYCNILK